MMQINLDQKNLVLTFLLTLFLQIASPVLLPGYRLNFLAPFLIILFYQKNYHFCLWSAFLCGFLLDLLSGPAYFGLYAISFACATVVLYRQRLNFFADSLTTLPLMTFFFSILTTLSQLLLLSLFEISPSLSPYWLLTDLIYMPSLDAIYAFFFLVLPAFWLGKRPRKGKDYFVS